MYACWNDREITKVDAKSLQINADQNIININNPTKALPNYEQCF